MAHTRNPRKAKKMASLMVKAETLAVGDTILGAYDREIVITAIKPFTSRARFIYMRSQTIKGENLGWNRLERDTEVFVKVNED